MKKWFHRHEFTMWEIYQVGEDAFKGYPIIIQRRQCKTCGLYQYKTTNTRYS